MIHSLADMASTQIIDNAKMWRDSWAALVNHQLQVVTEYEGLYDPIVGAADGQSRQAVPTPPLQLERTFKLKKAYTELKSELLEEMILIEDHIMKPATDARNCIAPIRKTIKKRENKRVDYEKAQERALKLQRKPGRTPKEDAALAKADADMSRAADVRTDPSTLHVESWPARLTKDAGIWHCRRPSSRDAATRHQRGLQSCHALAFESRSAPEPAAGPVLHDPTRLL